MRTPRLILVVLTAVVAAAIAVTVAVQFDQSGTSVASKPTSAPLGTPLRVTIPAIAVDAPLVAVGLEASGAMQLPEFGHAGWYDLGPKPGEPGPAVVVAHLDSKLDGPDVFNRLRELHAKDRVTVHYPDGATRAFAVTAKEQVAKKKLATTKIWNATPNPVLRLITCAGPFDRKAGTYLDNLIIYADELVSPSV